MVALENARECIATRGSISERTQRFRNRCGRSRKGGLIPPYHPLLHAYNYIFYSYMRRERRSPAFTKPIPPGESETKQEIKTYLKDLAKELHKPVRHKFPPRKVYVQRKNQTWSMDLADMSTWKRENDGYTYILTLVDVFNQSNNGSVGCG